MIGQPDRYQDVRNCPACAAACPQSASWCGQCYAALDGATAVVTAAAPTVPSQPSAHTALPPPPAYPPPVAYQPTSPQFSWDHTAPFPLAPGGRIAPPTPPPVVPLPPPANGMLNHRAVLLVCVAIGIGAVGMGLSWLLGQNSHMEPDTAIRYTIVIALGVYAVVGALLVTQLTPNVRLTWRVGNPWAGGALGVGVGGGLGLLMLLIVSGLAGHLSSDPRVVTIMSEGDAAHIGIAVLITCVCAPLVEEVLFRGLLLESLRTRGTAFGIWMSGIAFAVWHLTPAALRYYALMGALLGFLYTKRGLVCSMAAHAGFNGVLTVAAIIVVLSPGKTFEAYGVSVDAPGGWSQDRMTGVALSLHGPSGAWFGVATVPTPFKQDLDHVTSRLTDGALGALSPEQLQIDRATVRQVHLPIGRGVEVDVTLQGHKGHMLFVPRAGQSVEVVFLSAGSLRAEDDFTKMLETVRVSG